MKNRQIKKYGDTWVIKLAPIDHKDYDLHEGDMIDIESSLFLHIQHNGSDCFASSQPSNKSKKQHNHIMSKDKVDVSKLKMREKQ